MPKSTPRVHISYGNPANHLIQLESFAETGGPTIEDKAWWTTNSTARRGDRILFYITAPVSAFVGTATVTHEPFVLHDVDSDWDGHYVAHFKNVKMLPRFVRISEAKARFPDWSWLRFPRRSTQIPNDLVENILSFLQADSPS